MMQPSRLVSMIAADLISGLNAWRRIAKKVARVVALGEPDSARSSFKKEATGKPFGGCVNFTEPSFLKSGTLGLESGYFMYA